MTIVQVQSLRAARNAGIVVPKETIDKAYKYLREATDAQGGVMYQLGMGGGGSGPLTAQAIACLFSIGHYHDPIVKRWLTFCQRTIGIDAGGAARFGHYEYTHYYYAQVAYSLGEDGYARLFPTSRDSERLTWNKYKAAVFDGLVSRQSSDGSWSTGFIGTIYSTCCFLTILQLDKATLPIYQR